MIPYDASKIGYCSTVEVIRADGDGVLGTLIKHLRQANIFIKSRTARSNGK